jgi:deoxyribodipyrimidine photo-lyase
MKVAIYWFRNDLRLADNPALSQATRGAERLLCIYCHPAAVESRWGFARVGPHRRHFLRDALDDLAHNLRAAGNKLIEIEGDATTLLPQWMRACGAGCLFCESINAPEELAEVERLRVAGVDVRPLWQSSMLCPADLPFAPAQLPDIFTAFRQAVEKAATLPALPLPAAQKLPAALAMKADQALQDNLVRHDSLAADSAEPAAASGVSSFPYQLPAFMGGETAALTHLQRYFSGGLAGTYKETRDQLSGTAYSTKFSPYLALGCISARQVYAALKVYEAARGANQSTYWIWFELLWRDYFRFLHFKYGRALYRSGGLNDAPPCAHDAAAFARWCRGETGEPLVDAAMHELAATGYLSNRLRQVAASYLIYDLGCDWRAGAAWFEAQLVDYDVYSNQGNWLYIAGRGTDPRGGRRFNPVKQAQEHDARSRYRALWSSPL